MVGSIPIWSTMSTKEKSRETFWDFVGAICEFIADLLEGLSGIDA